MSITLYAGLLTSLFCVVITASNLMFQKFVTLSLGGMMVTLSVGVLYYPLTFLLMDIITECFGLKQARHTITLDLISSLFILGLVTLAQILPAASWSPVGDERFAQVFGQYGLAITGSYLAYWCSQQVDVMLFHSLKQYTQGRHLWLRVCLQNNYMLCC